MYEYGSRSSIVSFSLEGSAVLWVSYLRIYVVSNVERVCGFSYHNEYVELGILLICLSSYSCWRGLLCTQIVLVLCMIVVYPEYRHI